MVGRRVGTCVGRGTNTNTNTPNHCQSTRPTKPTNQPTNQLTQITKHKHKTQDNFGYEETALGMVFALNGIAVGVLQVRSWVFVCMAFVGVGVLCNTGSTWAAHPQASTDGWIQLSNTHSHTNTPSTHKHQRTLAIHTPHC